jgi:hypothetical protein
MVRSVSAIDFRIALPALGSSINASLVHTGRSGGHLICLYPQAAGLGHRRRGDDVMVTVPPALSNGLTSVA